MLRLQVVSRKILTAKYQFYEANCRTICTRYRAQFLQNICQMTWQSQHASQCLEGGTQSSYLKIPERKNKGRWMVQNKRIGVKSHNELFFFTSFSVSFVSSFFFMFLSLSLDFSFILLLYFLLIAHYYFV